MRSNFKSNVVKAMNKFLMILAVFLFLTSFHGQSFAVGELDLSFNQTGRVFTSFDTPNTFLHDLAVQPDGKIVAVGYASNGTNYDIAVVRYNPNGSPDTGFDGDGKVLTAIGPGNDSAKSVAIQPDGKILVGGSSFGTLWFNFALVRYNADGSLDRTFGNDGKLTTQVGGFYSSITAIAIQSDGKIVAVGDGAGDERDFAIVRYRSDGTLDASFGNQGIQLTPINFGFSDSATDLVIQPDGKIVAVGVSTENLGASFVAVTSFVVVRYNRQGLLDQSFDGDGKLIVSFGTQDEFADSVSLQKDGKFLISGKSGQFGVNGMLVRLNPDGSLDNSFDGDGFKVFPNETVDHPIIQPDGKILFARRFGLFPDWTFVTSRILANGVNDSQFGTSGSSLSASGVNALQPDGKIVVGAIEMDSFAVSRLTGDSPSPSQADISGRLVNQNSRGIGGAFIEITDIESGWSKVVAVNNFGYFRFDNLPTNKIYKLKIISKRLRFAEHSFHLLDELSGLQISPE